MYKLLIVDDEFLERKAMRLIIKKNFRNLDIVDDAKTGNEAVLLARKYKPDIIIMDIKMPDKNGLEAHKLISEFLPNVKTIILTAYDSFNFAQNAIKLGIADYMLKPAKPTELKQSIDKIISFLEYNRSKNYPTSIISDDNGDDAIHKAIQYIYENFNNTINLESVATHVHLNPQYFSRYFKNNTGINFIDYISSIRLEEAKRLLATTNKSISSISLIVGYIDPTYFSKVFMKHEGISPLKYRFMNKNQTVDINIT